MNIEVMTDEFDDTDTRFETVKNDTYTRFETVNNRFTIKDLLNEMSDLEREFVCTSNAAFSSIERIYHNPKFLLWRSKVIDLLSNNTNCLAQKIVKELERFDGWSDRTLFNNIKAELTVLADNQENEDVRIMVNSDTSINENSKPNKILVSHASKDKEYMSALIEMLEGIGMSNDSFVCSSVPGYGIPGGEDIFDWLRKQFIDYNLRVLFALSHNYYNSYACLNEMGAAWIVQTSYDLLLLPGFDFKDIEGCVNSRKIGISFSTDDEELKHRLNEFKDTLVSEYELQPIRDIRWEHYRDQFIRKVKEIFEKNKMESKEEEEKKAELELGAKYYLPVTRQDEVGNIPVDPALLLVYASEDGGKIRVISDIDGVDPYITTSGGKKFMTDFSHRESARWQDALNLLISWGWVKQCSNSSEVFELTGLGYNKADMLKYGMSIDTSKDPLEEIKNFYT